MTERKHMNAEYSPIEKPAPYILVVEDSPIDFEIIMRSFKKASFNVPIHRCQNGDDALGFLMAQKNGGQNSALPTVVLLDLNLPGTDGREVLKVIKSDPGTSFIPVIILSTSNNDNDVEYCLSHGANKYFMKPISPDDFVSTISVVKSFWEALLSHQSVSS